MGNIPSTPFQHCQKSQGRETRQNDIMLCEFQGAVHIHWALGKISEEITANPYLKR